MVVARGAGAAGIGAVEAAASFGPVRRSEPVASMLVSILLRVVGEWYPRGGVINWQLDAILGAPPYTV